MKKIVGLFLLMTGVVMLTACAEIPNGVDEKFHNQALVIFEEIDNDTMEMEQSDADDVANFQLIKAMADSTREMDFVNGIEGMLKTQKKVVGDPVNNIAPDGKALTDYMQGRQAAMGSMNLGDVGDSDTFEVSSFQFTEETD